MKFGRLQLKGFIGWLFWSVVHIYFLIGLRNRFIVAFTWLWDYLTFQRGARLITEVPGGDEGAKRSVVISRGAGSSKRGCSGAPIRRSSTSAEPVVALVLPVAAGYLSVTAISITYLGFLKPSLVGMRTFIGKP